MRSDDLRQRLYDIRDNIEHARTFMGSMTPEAFARDLKTVYAVIRALEIISEASRHLPAEIKAQHATLDWIAIRDAGNVYRHTYEVVTEGRIWHTVRTELEPLKQVVLEELERLTA